jgi:hypothetical protein
MRCWYGYQVSAGYQSWWSQSRKIFFPIVMCRICNEPKWIRNQGNNWGICSTWGSNSRIKFYHRPALITAPQQANYLISANHMRWGLVDGTSHPILRANFVCVFFFEKKSDVLWRKFFISCGLSCMRLEIMDSASCTFCQFPFDKLLYDVW